MYCRSCGAEVRDTLVDLGKMPPANSYIKKEDLSNETAFDLKVVVCGQCHLAQVTEVVPPEFIFKQYAYFSSYSKSWLEHAERYVEHICEIKKLDHTSLVIEVASNDGYLLKNFVAKDIPVLGIEPATNIASVAEKNGIRTINEFLNLAQAKKICAAFGHADLVIGNNVFAHVPLITEFAQALSMLLKDNGVLTLEFPHLLKLIELNQFDTIYHEHYSYLSILAIKQLFLKVGLKIHDIEELETHGGSLRIYVSKKNSNYAVSPRVQNILEKEQAAGMLDGSAYINFNLRVKAIKADLTNLLQNLKAAGHSVIGYGAAAKGNTLLNYCQFSPNLIDYIADVNPNKQNLLMPGNHIPIVSPEQILETKPDYILILPWNLTKEIMAQLEYVRRWGAKFIIPIPKVEIL